MQYTMVGGGLGRGWVRRMVAGERNENKVKGEKMRNGIEKGRKLHKNGEKGLIDEFFLGYKLCFKGGGGL